jgi:hypothetical protein
MDWAMRQAGHEGGAVRSYHPESRSLSRCLFLSPNPQFPSYQLLFCLTQSTRYCCEATVPSSPAFSSTGHWSPVTDHCFYTAAKLPDETNEMNEIDAFLCGLWLFLPESLSLNCRLLAVCCRLVFPESRRPMPDARIPKPCFFSSTGHWSPVTGHCSEAAPH